MKGRPDLPKYSYLRGNRIWVRYKDENNKWVSKPCGDPAYTLEQVEEARRYIRALLRGVERKRERGTSDPETVAAYAETWLKDREKRKLACAEDDRRRLERYALPHIGHIPLEQLRPRHVRDMIRELNNQATITGKPAPRTIHHVYNTLHTMMRSAIVEELYFNPNPVTTEVGELPKKLDKDPEWRTAATYRTKEVVLLIDAPIIPVQRRVMNALKALGAMRHGEAAAICWRHRDKTYEPYPKLSVVQAWDSRNKQVKRTKTGETRDVPEHPVLTQILDAWFDQWSRIYGRAPTPDDFIVPALTGRCSDPGDANEAFKRDLAALGLRIEAGKERDRGGHDLRSWFMTQTIEDGADSMIIHRVTHAPPKSVTDGYRRFSWATLCREVGKLQVVLDGEPLRLATHSLQAELKAGGRWRKEVTPKGLEAVNQGSPTTYQVGPLVGSNENSRASVSAGTHNTVTKLATARPPLAKNVASAIEKAIREGDLPKALEFVEELRSRGARA